jgi:hypothetical protein
MNRLRVEQAAFNNAVWCDTVCRAHSGAGRFLEDLWINRRPTPRAYPNAVTLTNARRRAHQVAHIRDLAHAAIPGEWGIKDSFSALALAPLRFRILFTAQWVGRPAMRSAPEVLPGVRWIRVRAAAELAAWESAWSRSSSADPHADAERVFPAALLADRDVAFIAAYRAERIVAGVIANRTDDVVGMSNLFFPSDDSRRLLAGCVAAVVDTFPGRPLVGYEARDRLAAMQEVGFDALGPLRIWVRRPAARPATTAPSTATRLT